MNYSLLFVFVGGGIGSILRYLTGKWVPATLTDAPFPWSVLAVNVVASAVLGWLMGWALARSANEELRLLIGVGFCGGLSTFSSFSYDLVILLQNGRVLAALFNVLLNVILCTCLAAGGFWLGQK